MDPQNRKSRIVPKLLGSQLAKKSLSMLSCSGGIRVSPNVESARNKKDIPKRKSPIYRRFLE